MDGHGSRSPMAADEVLPPSQAVRLVHLLLSDLARESSGNGAVDGHDEAAATIQPDGQFTILHIHGSATGAGDDGDDGTGVGVGGEYDGPFMMTLHMVQIHGHAGAGEDGEGAAYRDGGFGAVPASREAIDGLPEAPPGDAAVREASCAVCLESLVEEEGDGDGGGMRIKKMPCCSRGFHERCIADWLRVSRLCPCCRFALPAAADDEEDADLEEGEVRGFRPYVLHQEEDDGEDDLENGELRIELRDYSEPHDDEEEEEDDDDEMEEGELRDSSGPYEEEEDDDDEMEEGELREEDDDDVEDELADDVDDELDDWMEYDEEEEDDDDDAYGAREEDYML